MPIVSDDAHAVDASAVHCVTKPPEGVWSLTVWLAGGMSLTL